MLLERLEFTVPNKVKLYTILPTSGAIITLSIPANWLETMAPTLSSTDLWARNVLAEDGAIDTTVLLFNMALALLSMTSMYMAVRVLHALWAIIQSRSPPWSKNNVQRLAETGNILKPMTARWTQSSEHRRLSKHTVNNKCTLQQQEGMDVNSGTAKHESTHEKGGWLSGIEPHRAASKQEQDQCTTDTGVMDRRRADNEGNAKDQKSAGSSSSRYLVTGGIIRRYSSLEGMDAARQD